MPQAPGLAVVLVGTRKDSETYVRNKKKVCEEVGIASFGETLAEDATEEEVLKVQNCPCMHYMLLLQKSASFIFGHTCSCCGGYAEMLHQIAANVHSHQVPAAVPDGSVQLISLKNIWQAALSNMLFWGGGGADGLSMADIYFADCPRLQCRSCCPRHTGAVATS